MSWWSESDWIDSEAWEFDEYEQRGTTPGMRWATNTLTGESGLFKPESYRKRSAYCEYAASKVAELLGIPSAKVLVGILANMPGCISLDVRSGYTDKIILADSLQWSGDLLKLRESSESERVYGRPSEMSFQGLLPFLTYEAELGLVKMMYFDCITDNPGRHESNYMFSIDSRGAINSLLPLFDHGLCFQEISYLHDFCTALGMDVGNGRDEFRGRGRGMRRGWFMFGGSSFPYFGRGGFGSSFPFDDLYGYIKNDYPELISYYSERIRSDEFRQGTASLGCYDFIMDKLDSFEGA
ncbi:MAG: hypothetical protein FWG30_00920 [Eubacteriaceae bacterium]|nr:hypothetical protein [Eubacteriaceae bacterium]